MVLGVSTGVSNNMNGYVGSEPSKAGGWVQEKGTYEGYASDGWVASSDTTGQLSRYGHGSVDSVVTVRLNLLTNTLWYAVDKGTFFEAFENVPASGSYHLAASMWGAGHSLKILCAQSCPSAEACEPCH